MLGLALVAALGLLATWLGRRDLAESYAVQTLRAEGVEARVHIDALDTRHVSGSLSLGPASAPTATVEHFEAEIAIGPDLGVTVLGVRMQRPNLNASVDRNGSISFGQLDGMIRRLQLRPSAPGAATPDIAFDNAVLRLATPAGALVLTGAGLVRKGRIVTLDLAAQPATVRFGGQTTQLRAAALAVRTRGEITAADAHIAFDTAGGIELRGADLSARLEGRLDLAKLRADGAALHAGLKVAAARVAGAEADVVSGAADLGNLSGGWVDQGLTLRGSGGAMTLAAQRGAFGGNRLAGVGVAATISKFSTGGRGPDFTLAVTSQGDAHAASGAASVGRAPVSLAALDLRWRGDAGFASGQPVARVNLSGSAQATTTAGGATQLAAEAPVGPADGSESSLAAGLRAVRVSAPAVGLDAQRGTVRISLGAPVGLAFADGGHAMLAPVPGAAVAIVARGQASGAVKLAVTGAHLPDVAATLTSYRAGQGGFESRIAGDAAFSLAGFTGLKVRSAGRLAFTGGAATFAADTCGPVSAAHVDLGAVSVQSATGQFCPRSGDVTLSVGAKGWRLAGRYADASGGAPGLTARFAAAAGDFALRGGGGAPIGGDIDVTGIEVADAAMPKRYQPVRAAGALKLDPAIWTGRFDIATLAGRPLGVVTLSHDPASSRGEAALEVKRLTFAKGGLQPGDLSPLAASISPVAGAVDFSGRVDWADEKVTSDGDLATDGLALKSPLGAVTGLKTRLHFVSLAPIETAPGQTVTADRIDAIVPLTALSATFRLTPDALDLTAAGAGAEDGRLSLAPTVIALDGKNASHGVLTIEALNIGKLIAASSLADKVDVDAVLSGRLPYALGPEGLRFDSGHVAAIRPGRISIHRDALTNGAVTNAVQDMAFQALEALAFQELDATVQSRPQGRLGVIFHIKGAFEPKVAQEANVPIADILNGKALKGRIPLPSHTPVTLNLDTSLNFDQMLSDYRHAFEFHVGGVQAQSPLHSDQVQR